MTLRAGDVFDEFGVDVFARRGFRHEIARDRFRARLVGIARLAIVENRDRGADDAPTRFAIGDGEHEDVRRWALTLHRGKKRTRRLRTNRGDLRHEHVAARRQPLREIGRGEVPASSAESSFHAIGTTTGSASSARRL